MRRGMVGDMERIAALEKLSCCPRGQLICFVRVVIVRYKKSKAHWLFCVGLLIFGPSNVQLHVPFNIVLLYKHPC